MLPVAFFIPTYTTYFSPVCAKILRLSEIFAAAAILAETTQPAATGAPSGEILRNLQNFASARLMLPESRHQYVRKYRSPKHSHPSEPRCDGMTSCMHGINGTGMGAERGTA
jgi:hypothetical protein